MGLTDSRGAGWRPFFAALILTCLVAGCATTPPVSDDPNSVRIVRDEWGVPHIYANSVYELFFGYGYAVAQDRLFQMEMARRSTQGTVAEVLGPDYLEFDTAVRRGFNPQSIHTQIAALDPADRDVLSGYAAGMNAWLAKVRAKPGQWLPQEFSHHNFSPADWTAYDIAMVFVGTMANRYADFNTEIENAAILAALQEKHGGAAAMDIFNSLNPRYTDGAPTTITAADWAPPTRGHVAKPSTAAAIGNPQWLAGRVQSQAFSGFSNCVVLGPDRLSGADAVLLNGPQFGWYVPAYVYSVGLHGAGFDVVGNTPFAYPGLLFGHNGTIGWGSTWGAGDIVDIYAETIDPNDPGRYQVEDEQWARFEFRDEVIAVRDQTPVTVRVQRSRHGAIVAYDAPTATAYAKRRSWDGNELEGLLAWLHGMRAANWKQFTAQAARLPFNINWYYADIAGNIGYAYTGHYPQRTSAHDNRLPVRGSSGLDWLGLKPFAENPHAINPQAGYLVNWNNKPAPGVLNPDEFWYSWSSADRVEILSDAVEAQPRFTPDEVWALLEPSSFADPNARYLVAQAVTAAADDASLNAAAQVLVRWNQHSRDNDADGYYDQPGTALFQRFVGTLLATVLADDLGSAFPFFAGTGYPAPGAATAAGLNIQTGTKAVVEALQGGLEYDFLNGRPAAQLLREAMHTAVGQLQAEYGAAEKTWLMPVAPRPFSHRNFLGIPQTLEAQAMSAPLEQNRGTENNMFVMANGAITGYEVTPPGQSGFIAPNGKRARHYADQFEDYVEFERKRMWFTPQEVNQAARSETRLTVTRP